MKRADKILATSIKMFLKPSFPTKSSDELDEMVRKYYVLMEEHQAVLNAMKMCSYQAWREGHGDSYPDVFEQWWNEQVPDDYQAIGDINIPNIDYINIPNIDEPPFEPVQFIPIPIKAKMHLMEGNALRVLKNTARKQIKDKSTKL